MSRRFRIGRVYPRLTAGGAERDILELLAGVGDTHMISTFVDGESALPARELAARYTLLEEPRFEHLVRLLSSCEIVHLHTINHHPLAPLAGLLAGPRLLLQTIHNNLAADACELVDFSILVNPATRDIVSAPERTEWIHSGILTPDPDSSGEPLQKPWFESGRPLTLVEVRRPEKAMAWTLEDLLATGCLDDVELRAYVVGVDGSADDPRVERVGFQLDPSRWIGEADYLICGSAEESFGRAPLEALALGTRPFVTDLPALRANLASFADLAPWKGSQAAETLRRRIEEAPARHEERARERTAGRAHVRDRFSVPDMIARTEAIYAREEAGERSFRPEDVHDADLPLFGRLIDDFSAGRAPRDGMRIDELSPTARGVLLWALAHYVWADVRHAPRLLQESHRLLGDRPVIVRDLERLEARCAGGLTIRASARSSVIGRGGASVPAREDHVHVGHLVLARAVGTVLPVGALVDQVEAVLL